MLKRLYPATVKWKFMAIVFIAFFVIFSIGIYFAAQEQYKGILIEQQSIAQTNYGLINSFFKAKSGQARALATLMALNQDNARAVADKDTQAIKELTLEQYHILKKEFNLSKFQFHLPPATSLFRGHKPEKYGDDLVTIRKGIVECNRTQKPIEGIEKGRFGFGIRGIVPVFYNKVHVGAVEFGVALNDDLLKSFKKNNGFDISIVVPEKGGFKFLARTHSLDIPEKSFPWLKKMKKSQGIHFKQVKKDGKYLLTLFAPLKDFQNKTIAVLALPHDMTPDIKKFKTNLLKIIIVSMGLFGILLVLFYLIYDFLVNRPVKKMIGKISQMATGDFTTQIIANMPQPDFSPTAEDENKRCWETIGSFSVIDIQCPKLLKGTYEDCQACSEVFQKTRMDEFQNLSSYFNALSLTVNQLVKGILKNTNTVHSAAVDLSKAAKATEQGMHQAADNSTEQGMHQAADNSLSVAKEAGDMSMNMNSVAAASEEASTNISMVSRSAGQMGEKIEEIAGKTEKAKQISLNAVEQTKEASDRVVALKTAATDISNVTETISDISEQTNLLALNATIEAARAGEAGKGFAVVASEIKELATQTFQATTEIKDKVEAIHHSTDNTTQGIMEISGIIDQVNEIVGSITKDMEVQSDSTEQIISSMEEASQGTQEVNQTVAQSSSSASKIAVDIDEISQITTQMKKSVETISEKSESLSALAKDSRKLISRLKV